MTLDEKKPGTIAFITATTANVYGARYAHDRGHDVIIFERKPNMNNDAARRLPEALLKRFDHPIVRYVKLTDIKKHLAKDLEIIFEADCDVQNGALFVNGKEFPTKAIVLNTGHKEYTIEGVYTYSYATDKQYAGASLEGACDKVEKIIDEIL